MSTIMVTNLLALFTAFTWIGICVEDSKWCSQNPFGRGPLAAMNVVVGAITFILAMMTVMSLGKFTYYLIIPFLLYQIDSALDYFLSISQSNDVANFELIVYVIALYLVLAFLIKRKLKKGEVR